MTIAYVQQKKYGEWADADCYSVAVGFLKRGFEVRPFTSSMLKSLAVEPGATVFGRREACARLAPRPGRKYKFEAYPYELRRQFMERSPTESTVASLIEDVQKPNFASVYVRASREPLLFPGRVVTKYEDVHDLLALPDAWVYRLRTLPIVSEHRLLYFKGECIASKYLRGEMHFPDTDWVLKLTRYVKSLPTVFCADIAVCRFPERPEAIREPTTLLKVCDFWSSGPWGLSPLQMSKLAEERWLNQLNVR